MGRTVTPVDLTDDEMQTIVNALKVALAVAEMDALKAHIRYDKDEMSYWSGVIAEYEEVLGRVDR